MQKNEVPSFVLRRSFAPYVLFVALVPFVMLISSPYVFRTHDWSPWEALLVIAPLISLYLYIQTRYRIWLQGSEITQQASDGKITKIMISRIDRIAQETSDVQTLIAVSQPFRRITIYETGGQHAKKIDVSLKHFNLDDIRQLVRIIHERRPDLSIPQGWV